MSYTDLINVDEFTKRDTFSQDRGDISFYCKDCKKIVETNRLEKKSYIFICKECGEKNISVGTLEGLKSNYKIKN